MREPSQHAEENGAHGKYSVCVCRRCIHAFGAFVRPTRHTRSFYRDAGLRGPPQRCLPHRISQAQSAAVFRLMPPKHETVEGNRGCVHGPWQYRIPLNATHAATASNPPSTRLCIYIYIYTYQPRPCKTTWHGDIACLILSHRVPQTRYNNVGHSNMTNVIPPHGAPQNNVTPSLVDTANHPATQQHASFTDACFSFPNSIESHTNTLSSEAAQKRMAH